MSYDVGGTDTDDGIIFPYIDVILCVMYLYIVCVYILYITDTDGGIMPGDAGAATNV